MPVDAGGDLVAMWTAITLGGGVLFFVLLVAARLRPDIFARLNTLEFELAGRPYRFNVEGFNNDVYVPAPPTPILELKGKRWWDEPASSVGLSVALKTGDEYIDQHFNLTSDSPLLRELMERPERLNEQLRALLETCQGLNLKLVDLQIGHGQLQVRVRSAVRWARSTRKRAFFTHKKWEREIPPAVQHILIPRLHALATTLGSLLSGSQSGHDRHRLPSVLLSSFAVTLAVNAGVQFFVRYVVFSKPLPQLVSEIDLILVALVAGTVITLTLCGLTLLLLWGSARAPLVLMQVFCLGLPGAVGSAFALARDINIETDNSPPQVVNVRVVDKWTARSLRAPRKAHYVGVSGLAREDALIVSPEVFKRVREGSTITLVQHRGALGHTWLARID